MEKYCEKYLQLLGVRKERPGLEALKRIIREHASTVPFENISKLFYKKRSGLTSLIDFELYLDGIEKYHFGGTCYANNFYLNRLLTWLGYEVKLCGADMKNPDVHIVNIVKIENREFLVDTGYGAPFSEPFPLDLSTDYEIIIGNERYVLKPRDDNNRHQMGLFRDGMLKHGYCINPTPRQIGEFLQVIANSFREEATFMNALLITRFEGDLFLSIRNLTVTEFTRSAANHQTLGSREQLARVIERRVGISEGIVLESLEGLQLAGDAWS